MAKNEQNGQANNSQANSNKIEKGGYRPLNEGYSPIEKKGYVPIAQGGLPKAPQGGTGESGGASTPSNFPSNFFMFDSTAEQKTTLAALIAAYLYTHKFHDIEPAYSMDKAVEIVNGVEERLYSHNKPRNHQ